MKKFFALFLSLMMLFAFATAEELNNYAATREHFEVEGDYMALEQFGLAMFIPADFISFEVPEEEVTTKGTLAVLGREDGTMAMTIAYAAMANAEGNLITTYEDLAAFYMASGAAVEVCYVHGLPAMTYVLPTEYASTGLCLLTEEGAVLNFCILSNVEEDTNLASLMLLSVCPVAAE